MNFFQRRIKSLKILGRLLQTAPFVRAVILTGSMTTGRARKSSDIDLLVITEPGRLYTARFFVTILTTLTGKRRKPLDRNPAGKFCLNYYLSADNLDILPRTARCAKFHRFIIPIWEVGEVYGEILRRNFWLRRHKVLIKNRRQVGLLKKNFPLKNSAAMFAIQKINEAILRVRIGDFFEKKMMNWQKKKIIDSGIYKGNTATIIVKKNELRLHPAKRRSKSSG